MTTPSGSTPDAGALALAELLSPADRAIVSRILAKTEGGSATLFAFAAGEALDTHTTPHQALAFVMTGRMAITVADHTSDAGAGTLVMLPASVPHAVHATDASLMLLVVLKGKAV